ncbi:element excision factor XisH family protein [Brunnivagina elsteri]|uniref:element excision factor XisH family protein n=1 Tax=Brunnivagina elsteri TaxID=1247191 RepID=UPI001FE78731|nr:element excision factor XisH family protein [Calothrix elsteri]
MEALRNPTLSIQFKIYILFNSDSLAVPSAIYNDFFNLPFTQIVVSENSLKIIIYDIDKEEIIEWLN